MFRKFFAPLFAVLFSVSVFHAPAARSAPMLDVMFLVDGSGSITAGDFTALTNSVGSIANTLATGIPGAGAVPDPNPPFGTLPADLLAADLHAGIVQFSTGATLDLGLTGDLAVVNTVLDNLAQQNGQTNHAAAFALAAAQLAANGRAGAQQAIVLLTDGNPNEPGGSNPVTDAIIQANIAKNDGILIFAVGIGNAVDQGTLDDYASAPTEDFTALVDDFDGLGAVNTPIAQQLLVSGFAESAAVSAPAPIAVLGLGIAALAFQRRRRIAAA